MPVYAAREDITVTDNKGNRIANDTIDMESDYNVYGANKVVNETFEDDALIPEQDRYFELAITARSPNNAVASDDVTTLTVTSVIPDIVTEVEELELGDQTAWSNPASWRFDPPRLPQDGDRLVIESDMNIVLDLPPVLEVYSLPVVITIAHGVPEPVVKIKPCSWYLTHMVTVTTH